MNKLIITEFKGHTFTALHDGKTIIEASVEDNENSYVGNIYIGRVENVVPSINAAFVEFTKGVKGYLSLNPPIQPFFINVKNTQKVCMGDLLLVQVERDPVKTKAAVLTTRLNISGKLAVLVDDHKNQVMVSDKIKNKEVRARIRGTAAPFTSDSYGIVMRTNCENVTGEEIAAELQQLVERRQSILEKAVHRKAFACLYEEDRGFLGILKNIRMETLEEIVTDMDVVYERLKGSMAEQEASNISLRKYEDKLLPLYKLYSLEHCLRDALRERVWLKSGGYLIIQPTEALVVIDVNTGKYSGGKMDREATFFKINSEAALEIARQIRLRNYSGIILIDFIDMENAEYNQSLIATLKTAIAKDSVKTTYVDMTALGLVELTRKKIKKPLHEQLYGKGLV